MRTAVVERGIKPTLFIACLIPAAYVVYLAVTNRLGPDPAETLVRDLGIWAIRFLWLTLAVTPLRKLTGQSWLTRLRRMLGLFAFFYVSLHFLAYGTFLLGWDFSLLGDDLQERPYIVVGFTALLLLVPLAVTSTDGWRRKLKRQWVRLHKLVYLISGLAILHFFWTAKASYYEHAIYLGVLLLLLGYRLYKWLAARNATKAAPAPG